MDIDVKEQRESLNVSILIFACWLMLVIVAVLPSDSEHTKAKARAAVFVIDVLILVVLVLRKSEIKNLIANTRSVLHNPRPASLKALDDFFIALYSLGAIASVFVVATGDTAALFAVRSSIVVFLVSLKILKDRRSARRR